MSAALVPCSACARHIRATEDSCPFCKSGAPDRERLAAQTTRAPSARLSRAALLLAGAAAAAGCGKTTAVPDAPDASPPDPSVYIPAPPYGAVPIDAWVSPTPVEPSPADAGATPKDGGRGKR